MKTKKLLALTLSMLMIILAMPIAVFAAPSAITAADTVHEHVHVSEEQAMLSSDLDLTTLYIDISALIEEGKTVDVDLLIYGNTTTTYAQMEKSGKNIFSCDVTEAVADGAVAAEYAICYTDDTELAGNLVGDFVTGKNMWVAASQSDGSWDVFDEGNGNIKISMTDLYGDGWDGAAIEIYQDNALYDTITTKKETNTYYLPYDETVTYTFKWERGDYDYECSFTISLGEDVLKMVEGAHDLSDGEIIFIIESTCEHSFSEPCGTCSVCSKVCGTDFTHKFDEDKKCTVCSFECGVTENHDWSANDGVCKVCSYSCPEHDFDENFVCVICNQSLKALVTSADGVYSEAFLTIGEAFDTASELENSTVKLIDDVSVTYMTYISNGKFTIDLNGKTWESDSGVLIIDECSDVKIISEDSGKIISTGDGYPAIYLLGTAKLEISGGTIVSQDNTAVNMSFSGNASSSELVLSGGKIEASRAIEAFGSRVTITGGEIESGGDVDVFYISGTLDFSGYADADGLIIHVFPYDDVSALDILLPENFVLIDQEGNQVTELVANEFLTIKQLIEIDLGEKDAETNIRYTEIGGVVTETEETDNKYGVVVGEENLLIEIVEKTKDGEFVKSQYFYVDMEEKTAAKLSMDSYMHTYDEKTIRIKDPMGIRFKAHILISAKNEETDYVIDEYGFIVATKSHLVDSELTLDTRVKAVGVAYDKQNDTDIVFGGNDEWQIFTGILKNIPVAHYKTDLVCKTYTKVTVDGNQFVIYGEPVIGNVYDTAEKLLEETPGDSELEKIILDYENLFSEA